MFESRVIPVAQYLTINSNPGNITKFVYEHEQQNIFLIQQKVLECYNVEHHETSTLKYLSKQFIKANLTAWKEKYTAKVMHGYYERKINNDTKIDKHLLEAITGKKINLLRHNMLLLLLLAPWDTYQNV